MIHENWRHYNNNDIVIILIKLVLNTRLIRNSKTNFPLLYKETFIQILILLLLVLILLLNSDINGVVFNLFYCNLETQQFKVFFLLKTTKSNV